MVKSKIKDTQGYNTLAVLSLIFTLLASPLGFVFGSIAYLLGPLGFIFGIIALSQIKKTNEKGRGLAIASIVIGSIFIFLVLIGIIWVIVRNIVGT